jgi:hypothetical protein
MSRCPVTSRVTCQANLSRTTCLSCPVPGVMSRMSFQGFYNIVVSSRLPCSSCPILVGMRLSFLVCLGCRCLVLAVSCPSCSTLAVLSQHSCPRVSSLSCLAVMSWPSYSLYPVQDDIRLTCQVDLSGLTCPGCPIPDVLSQMSNPDCSVTVVLFLVVLLMLLCLTVPSSLSCYGSTIPAVFSDCSARLSCPAVLSQPSCPSCLASPVQTDLPGRPFQTHLFRLSCPSCHTPDVMSYLVVIHQMSCPECTLICPASWAVCSVRTTLSKLSCSGFPFLSFLS